MDQALLNKIKEQISTKHAKNYSNLTFFFLIFSIFAFFIIRPSLSTAFSLQTKEKQLTQTQAQYEQIVSQIPVIQQGLESLRESQPIIISALPQTPIINGMLSDIARAGEVSGITITKLGVSDVILVGTVKPTLKHILVDVEALAPYDKFLSFQSSIHKQRRLKKIKNFEIIKENSQSSLSGLLKMKIQVEGYYL